MDLVFLRHGNRGGNSSRSPQSGALPAPLPAEESTSHLPVPASRDSLRDTVKGLWEVRFERRYGFWRGFLSLLFREDTSRTARNDWLFLGTGDANDVVDGR